MARQNFYESQLQKGNPYGTPVAQMTRPMQQFNELSGKDYFVQMENTMPSRIDGRVGAKEKEEGEEPRCAAVTRNGTRCKGTPVDGTYCTIHTKTEKRSDGKEVQCKKIKSDGNRCKMKTKNKSGLCYYHD